MLHVVFQILPFFGRDSMHSFSFLLLHYRYPETRKLGPIVMLNKRHHSFQLVSELSEDIRRVCCRFNIRFVLKSGQALRSILTRVKDELP